MEISFLLLLMLRFYAEGQVSVGIVKTSSDFSNGIVFSSDSEHQLHLHDLFAKNYIDIVHNDSSYRFQKNEIYGYCDHDGKVYRFFNNKTYPILNPGEKILLYKITTGTGLKNSSLNDYYFFSKENSSEILPLSYQNLCWVFADIPAFLLVLEIYYKNEADLLGYDTFYNTYKLNRLFELSKKLKINETN